MIWYEHFTRHRSQSLKQNPKMSKQQPENLNQIGNGSTIPTKIHGETRHIQGISCKKSEP
jgi:hypothetical protein